STNIKDTSTIKKIASGDSIDAEEKGKPKFSFTPYCKLIFSSNTIPKIGTGDDVKAVMSRMVIVPLNANFSERSKDFKPFIIDDITSDEAMSYL
ncbi:DNA primase, partial [Streptococcus danieliae]|nr:DNA primase [Streptococcus danieliae]